MIAEIIGYLAGTLTTLSFLPQVIKVVRTKNTDGISFYMYLIFLIGVFGWLIYGILIKSTILVIFNSITLTLAGTILFYLIKHGNKTN